MGLFRNDVTPLWTFLDPYPPPCHQDSPFDEPPPTPPLGDIICEQSSSQKFPAHLEYSFTQQSLPYANSTPEFLE